MRKEDPPFPANDHMAISSYYDQTQFDYRVAWTSKDDFAVHFGFYDARHTTHRQALLNTNKVMADLAQVSQDEHVLDAGCGQGGSAFWLVQNKNARVTGISPVKTQIDQCLQNARQLGVQGRATFTRADFCATPFQDNSFDVIWACESVCHATDKALFYQEAFRLLRPGGRLVMAEYLRTGRPLKPHQETLLSRWLSGWAIPGIDTPSEHLTHAKQMGFDQIMIRDYTQIAWISLKNLHKISRRWAWIGYVLHTLGIRNKVQHGNHMGGIFQFQALNQGAWFYGVITAVKR
jgi:tocopherol O-methyltransferase